MESDNIVDLKRIEKMLENQIVMVVESFVANWTDYWKMEEDPFFESFGWYKIEIFLMEGLRIGNGQE